MAPAGLVPFISMTDSADCPAGGAAPCGACALADACPALALSGRASPDAAVLSRSRKSGAWLQRESRPVERLVYIKSGLAALWQRGPDGRERIVGLTGRGHLVGQHAPYQLPAALGVQARTSLSVCEMPAAQVSTQLRERLPAVLMRFNHQSTALLAAWGHVMRMPTLSLRLAAALWLIGGLQSAGAMRLPSQRVLAELLGVTRESINRRMREFEALGMVRRCGARQADIDRVLLQRLFDDHAAQG